MHILFLSPVYPSPVGGEKLRPYYIMKYLSRRHRITLFCFLYREDASEEFDLNIDAEKLPFGKFSSWFNCIRGIFSNLPIQIFYFHRKEMRYLIKEELKKNKYDLIFCHCVRMSEYVKDFKSPKKVLDMCDALSQRYRLSYKYRGFPFGLVEFIEGNRLKNYEPYISRFFDLNLISSSLDKEYLEKLGAKNIFLLENGVEYPEQIPNINIDYCKIVFFANFRPFPNKDALIYFYKKIFPLVKEEIKKAKLTVVGADIPDFIRKSRDPSLEIYNCPQDIRSSIENGCVSVAPMRISVGIQNKILQSMAFGIPVVSTSLGLGGIKAQPDRDILIADTPKEFSRKVIMLMKDKELRRKISQNAFEVIKKNYKWEDIVNKLEQRLLELVGEKD